MENTKHQFSAETKYRLYIDGLKADIIEAVTGCFDATTDPKICFDVFRGALRRFKKENVEAYLDYSVRAKSLNGENHKEITVLPNEHPKINKA